MGVSELGNFMKGLRGGVKNVSIKEEIINFNMTHAGLKKPILVFDVMSIVSILSEKTIEILCGGRHQMYAKLLDLFFMRLRTLNAELVFFLDGSVKESKITTWAMRQNRKYEENLKLMNFIDSHVELKNIAENLKSKIHTNIMLNVIEAFCHLHGQLFYTVKHECDQELAQFAYDNPRVLAVFSCDSDFLIFPGQWRYFSITDLNVKTLATKEYDRVALREHLSLSSFQMAIFATIAGNDIVRIEELSQFHASFNFRRHAKFPGLAQYIKSNFSELRSHSEVLKVLAKDIYGNANKNLKRINSSINSYNVHPKDEKPMSDPNDRFLAQHHLFTYNVLSGAPLNFSLVFFNLSESEWPSYFDLAVPMFQRQAGIVLFHSKSNGILKILTKTSHNSSYRQTILPAVPPPLEVPLLDELYSSDRELDCIRFDLLKWTICWEKLQDIDLQKIPGNYMIDVLTIVFMRQLGVLSSKESDILLWTIKCVENDSIPKGLKPPAVLDPRAFRIAFLYGRIFGNVARSIEVCGLKDRYWKYLSFDGVFFHNEYLRFKNMPFNTEELLNEL